MIAACSPHSGARHHVRYQHQGGLTPRREWGTWRRVYSTHHKIKSPHDKEQSRQHFYQRRGGTNWSCVYMVGNRRNKVSSKPISSPPLLRRWTGRAEGYGRGGDTRLHVSQWQMGLGDWRCSRFCKLQVPRLLRFSPGSSAQTAMALLPRTETGWSCSKCRQND